jgi:Ca2+-binding EF-hand superfamily protein
MDALVAGGFQQPALMMSGESSSPSPAVAAPQANAPVERESTRTAALVGESLDVIMEELRCVHSKVIETSAKVDLAAASPHTALQPSRAPIVTPVDMSSMRYNASPRIINLSTELATTGVPEESLPLTFAMADIDAKQSAADFQDKQSKRGSMAARHEHRKKSAIQTWAGAIDAMTMDAEIDYPIKNTATSLADTDVGVENVVKSILDTVPHNLNGFKIFDMRSLFKAMDRDGTGSIGSGDLHAALSSLAGGVTKQAVDEFYMQYGIRSNGAMTWKDFEKALAAVAEICAEERRIELEGGTVVLPENVDTLKARMSIGTISQKMRSMGTEQKGHMVDCITASIILLNAITIGFSMDHEYASAGVGTVFFIIDVVFTCLFLTELAVKAQGILSLWNCFDLFFSVADITQLVLAQVFASSLADSTPPAFMFRMVRLIRLGRMARFTRLKICEDFVAMISGMWRGMTRLAWSIILFILIIYICALMFREFFGQESERLYDIDMTSYFSTVPRSIFTVFRYCFGDFSTAEGYNLFEGLQKTHGAIATLFACILLFLITVGLLNVISAMFVESTLAAASSLQRKHKQERLSDAMVWSTRISVLIRKLFEYHGVVLEGSLSENLSRLAREPVTEDEFNLFIRDSEVGKVLGELEIYEADRMVLFGILDNDNTGSICMYQLVDGLKRLRGEPRRSDVIRVDLMVRSILEHTDQLIEGMDTALYRLSLITRRLRKS